MLKVLPHLSPVSGGFRRTVLHNRNFQNRNKLLKLSSKFQPHFSRSFHKSSFVLVSQNIYQSEAVSPVPQNSIRKWASTATARATATATTNSRLESEFPQNYLDAKHAHDENNHVKNYLRNNPAYRNTLFMPGNSTGRRFHPSAQKFVDAALNPECNGYSLNSEENQPLLQDLLTNINALKDNDLFNVLYHIPFFTPSDSHTDSKYMEFWSSLDNQCVNRMSSWSIDKQFQVADLWNRVHLARSSKFHHALIKKCYHKCSRLSKEQFIRFMFCLNVERQMRDAYGIYEVEDYLSADGIEKFNYNEISIIAMALFKTETVLRNYKIVKRLLEIVMDSADKMDSISVAAVAKFARFNSFDKYEDILIQFQKVFLTEIDRLSIPAITHLALVGTKCQMPYMPLVDAVVDKIQNRIKEARLKELERVTLAMTMFGATECKGLCEMIVEELRLPERADEIRMYGRSLPAILHYLSLQEIYPEDLISKVLDKQFRSTYYGQNSERYQRELLCLDICVELEVTGYTGQRLDLKTREHLIKKNSMFKPPGSKHRVTDYESKFRKIASIVETFLGGKGFFHVCNVLPQHHSIDIVFCIDAKGNPVKMPHNYRKMKEYEIKYIPEGDQDQSLQYHAVFTCGKNLLIRPDDILTGAGHLQIRQLQKLGYVVHVILLPKIKNDIDVTNILQNGLASSTSAVNL